MLSMDSVQQIVTTIVLHQQTIIGPLALDQANKVSGLSVTDGEEIKVNITKSDTNRILTQLVEEYEELFGRASIEVCKDAVKEVQPPVPHEELPEILR